MCIATWTTTSPRYALVLAANRDEYLRRPTEPTALRRLTADGPEILCGLDVLAGGTWAVVAASQARIALLTNVRETEHDSPPPAGLRSRGDLATLFLTAPADETLDATADRIRGVGDQYAGFNLLLMQFRRSSDGRTVEVEAVIVTNRPGAGADEPVAGPSCVLTNGAGTRWPKIALGREVLDAAIAGGRSDGDDPDRLIAALLDGLKTSIADVDPRDTVGVSPRRREKGGGWYTTRSQLAVLVERDATHPRAHVVARDAWVAGPDGEPVWSGREHGRWTLDLAL